MKFDKTFKIALALALFVVIAVAYFDTLSASSGIFGTIKDYTIGNYTKGWWSLFQTFVLFIFALVPLCYYFFYRKDKSEAIAIFLVSYICWMFGLADIFYFWLQGQSVPSTLPWLINQPILSKVAGFLHAQTITNVVLYISAALGVIISLILARFLEEKF